jgi:assimilatory nitrate reductase catalytic subunit
MFTDGRFFTPDGKARVVDVRAPALAATAPGFPLTLNTGRVRDHWHTMTRTGKSARLSRHYAEPFVEIHPEDAARHRIGEADLVRVSTGLGAILVRALITPRMQPGSIFVPMHWNDQFAARARVDVLAAAVTDPTSGQPALKNVPARIERFVAATYGFAVLRRKPEQIAAEYWAIAKCDGGWRVELAFAADSDDWPSFVRDLVGSDGEPAAYRDSETGRMRFACYEDGYLAGTVFLAREPVAVSRDWAVSQLVETNPAPAKRSAVLAGRPGAGGFDRGSIVCACFGIGANEIAGAVARGCTSVATVGAATQAGTNCGSCRAEIRNILDAQLSATPTAAPRVVVPA